MRIRIRNPVRNHMHFFELHSGPCHRGWNWKYNAGFENNLEFGIFVNAGNDEMLINFLLAGCWTFDGVLLVENKRWLLLTRYSNTSHNGIICLFLLCLFRFTITIELKSKYEHIDERIKDVEFHSEGSATLLIGAPSPFVWILQGPLYRVPKERIQIFFVFFCEWETYNLKVCSVIALLWQSLSGAVTEIPS